MNGKITKQCMHGQVRALLNIAVASVLISIPCIAESAPLSSQQLRLLMQKCAPWSNSSVLRSVAHVESNFDPLTLRNNAKHVSIALTSVAASADQAKLWISRGNSVDIGLMQINSSNLSALGMTIEDALDPCRSLDAGARILSAAYTQGTTVADRQAALLIALSRYNTGRSLAGLANGYVGQVLAAQDNTTIRISKRSDLANSQRPNWDIWAVASSAQHDGAAWLVGSRDTHDFLIGAGAQPIAGEPHAMSQGPGTAPGM